MIKANELRIGNYILINGARQQVNSINARNNGIQVGYLVAGVEKVENCTSATVQPLLLNNEVLADCGFEFDDYYKLWQKKIDGKKADMQINLDYDITDFMRRPLIKAISSLHQLQNIYFALKGNELEFSKQKDLVH